MARSSDKMDDMNKLIKNLSAKVNRLEMENKNLSRHVHEGNPNQFRKPFVPRFITRERRNNDIQRERKESEDQRIQPPFQNNLLNEEGEIKDIEYEDFDQDINHLEDESYESYLTKYQYLNAEILEDCSHYDIYPTKPKNSYNLRYGVKQVVQNPKKKAVAKQYPDLPSEKNQNHRPSKAKITELEETNKGNQGFNFENEMNKLKIPIPLTKLMKIPSFIDPSYRMLRS